MTKNLDNLQKKYAEVKEQRLAQEKQSSEQVDEIKDNDVNTVDAIAKTQRNRQNRIAANTTSLARLQNAGPTRPSKLPYQGKPNIMVKVSFSRTQPVGVAVIDVSTGTLLDQSIKLLLTKPVAIAQCSIVILRFKRWPPSKLSIDCDWLGGSAGGFSNRFSS